VTTGTTLGHSSSYSLKRVVIIKDPARALYLHPREILRF